MLLPQKINAQQKQVGTIVVSGVQYPVYEDLQGISTGGYYFKTDNGTMYEALKTGNDSFDVIHSMSGEGVPYFINDSNRTSAGLGGLLTVPTTEATQAKTEAAASAASSISHPDLYWTPNVGIGEFVQGKAVKITGNNLLGTYINIWYKFLVGLAGLLATVMIIMGGITWLTSGGSSATIGDAKKTISSALIGLTLALLSYALLQIINPNLTTISPISLGEIKFDDNYIMPDVNLDSINTSSMTASPTSVTKGKVEGFSDKIQNKNGQQAENLKSDLKGVTNGLIDGCNQANKGDCGTIGLNSAFRNGDGPHGTYEALDLDRSNTAFNSYMNSLVQGKTPAFWYYKDGTSSTVAPKTEEQIAQAQPAYILTTSDGTRFRVINETINNCWHIDVRK